MSDDADDELLTTVLFLINRGYWLALYELYVDARRTNALEKDLPARNTLRSFFGDRQRFPADVFSACLLYTSPSPRDKRQSRMPSSA